MKNSNVNFNFDFYDQFSEIEIDLSEYLVKYSTTDYKLQFSNLQPVKTTIKNLFDKYKLIIDFTTNKYSFFEYNIVEGETAYSISYKKYQTPDYWWLIYILNNIKNPFYDWPLSQEQLNNQTDILYNRIGKYSRQFYYDYLFEQNENKRLIRLPYIRQILDIVTQYRNALMEKES